MNTQQGPLISTFFFPLGEAKAFHYSPDTVTGTEVPSLGKKPGDEGRERAGRGAE